MPKALGNNATHPPTYKQVHLLENKVNKLRWVNNDLNKQVFAAIQRGHRLAAKLGYKHLEDAELALATQPGEDAGQSEQGQLEHLSRHSQDELVSHVQALQSELIRHVQLSKSTLGALGDALTEMTGLREENERLMAELGKVRAERADVEVMAKAKGKEAEVRKVEEEGESKVPSAAFDELAFVSAELASLKGKYESLRKSKQEADDKHAEDFRRWKGFKQWWEKKESGKRRKLDPDETDNAARTRGRVGKVKEASNFARKRKKMLKSHPSLVPPARADSAGSKSRHATPAVLTSRSLNSSSVTPPSSSMPTPESKVIDSVTPGLLQKIVKRNSAMFIANDHVADSSETEADSQPVTFLYPSQLEVTGALPSIISQKCPRSAGSDRGSSETEFESQAPAFLFPSQIVPLTRAQAADLTPTPPPPIRLGQAQYLHTPISTARPRSQQMKDGKPSERSSAAMGPPSSPSDSRADSFYPPPRALGMGNTRLPDTPITDSRGSKKRKERAEENDENDPMNTRTSGTAGASVGTSGSGKKYPSDYSIYKGRGRYGAEVQAGKETINGKFEIDRERNGGVGFQFEEVVRDKERRKQMHASDCECCRDYYESVGPLPSRLQPPQWRSPVSSPTKNLSRDSFDNNSSEDERRAAIEERKQAISRHREDWKRGDTPPGFWTIGFPDTQEAAMLNAEAGRMHERKRAMIELEAKRGGKYRRR